MNDLTEGGTLEGETRGETILHWMVECPETDRLAEADIPAPRRSRHSVAAADGQEL